MKKLLVIEDEPAVLENIIELLDGEEYQVKGADNGYLGIEIAKEFLPDLIICDIMMPEIDGYGVLKNLQIDSMTSTIPFIFLTAKSELNDIRYGMGLGADDYITKPFLPEELYRTIKTRFKKLDNLSSKSEKQLQELRMNIASTLPHELRTPLNGILASSQILMDYYDTMDSDEVKQLHKNIFNSSKRLHDLIAMYLFYTDVELLYFDSNRRDKLFNSCIPINSSDTIYKTFLYMAKEYNRENDLNFNLAEAHIDMYMEHFQHVCEELASNALKFSVAGKEINIQSEAVDGLFQLIVTDNGRGISADHLKKIGAYVQFDRKIYEQQGSGLGLIITQRLVQIYKGKISIQSELDKFTRITITLPLNQEKN